MIKIILFIFSLSFCFDSADGVVAIVGDYPILKSTVLQSAQMFLVQQGKQNFSSQEELNMMLKESLESLINQRVLFEKAKQDTDIVVTNEDVNLYIDNYIENLISEQGSEKNLELALGQTINSFKKESWDEVYKLITTERFQQKLLLDFDVTIKDVQSFYKINSSSLPLLPKKYKFSLIDIPIIPSKKRKKEIYDYLISLKDSIKNSSFDNIAKKYSEDPGSSINGGDLGYISRGTLVKEYEKEAFSLNVGDISNPILTDFGYHLIMLIDKKGEKIRTKHILKTINPNEEDKNFAQKKLIEINNLVTKNSSIFDSLAILYSKNKNNISSVNDWVFSSDMDEKIESELKKLEKNTVSYPIEMKNSFLLIKLYDKQEETKASLENSWSFIKNLAYQDKLMKKLEELLNVYKEEIYIKYYN